jgi:hypothetical protein
MAQEIPINDNTGGWSPAEQVDRGEPSHDNAGGWSYVRAREDDEPDALDLVLLKENIGQLIYPYGWKDDIYISQNVRESGNFTISLAKHINHHKDKISEEYFIVLKNSSPWEVRGWFQMTQRKAEQIFELAPEKILEEFNKPETQDLRPKSGIVFQGDPVIPSNQSAI